MTTTDVDFKARIESALDELLTDFDAASATAEPSEFLGKRFDLGLAWVWFDEGVGGMGAPRSYQAMVETRLGEVGAPTSRNLLGVGMGAPVLAEYGSREQQERWLRPMFTEQEIWCQMFSEPGAGSDVAGLAARGVRDGDEWVVNGQKVWTTIAHLSKWGMLIVRTDPDVPKHRGLTYFIVDMKADGVEVRPLRQATGEAEFNEVYFTDVRIPDENRIGGVGDGWRVTVATLMNERVAIGGTVSPRNSGAIGVALDVWKEYGHDDPALRDDLMRLWVEAEAARLTNLRATQMMSKGTPGPEGSLAKLVYAELNKRIFEMVVDLMGPDGMLYDTYEMARPGEFPEHIPQKAFIRSRANSIEGGTSEIMKNIVGERILGLPGEPRVDKDLPWSEVPR
ncbi:MAG TPA: acyl-CoA dehydrogenase family protein [Acidimicrobiia bacterium]|nr:acyl-CoA dehydrogenase family protein [Acidimicrobiia bacterium]